MVKSSLDPFSRSRLGPSSTILGAAAKFCSASAGASSFAKANTVSSSLNSDCSGFAVVVVDGVNSASVASEGGSGVEVPEFEAGSDGSVTRPIWYWNPWHPPDSTCIRSARCGLLSFAMILVSRYPSSHVSEQANDTALGSHTCAARGVISSSMSSPFSSTWALCMACVLRLKVVALKSRLANLAAWGCCATLRWIVESIFVRGAADAMRKARVCRGENTSGRQLCRALFASWTNSFAAEGPLPHRGGIFLWYAFA